MRVSINGCKLSTSSEVFQHEVKKKALLDLGCGEVGGMLACLVRIRVRLCMATGSFGISKKQTMIVKKRKTFKCCQIFMNYLRKRNEQGE